MEVNESYGKRMWRMWGPLIIKFGISMMIYFVGMAALMGRYIAMEGAKGGTEALSELTRSQEKYSEMIITVTNWMFDCAVPIEGIAALLTIPIMLFLMRRDKVKEKLKGEVFLKAKAAFWKYPAIMLISAAMCLALNNLMLLGDLSSYSDSYEGTVEMLYQPSFAVQIICLGILMPVCEELVFRGLMYRRMRKQTGFMMAALYSSIVFAITHGNLVQCVYGFAMGMMFAYVYEKYGSVLAPVTAHITANLLAVVGTQYQWFDWLLEDVMRIGTVTVVCAALASTVFVLMQRMEAAFPKGKMQLGENGQSGQNK